MAKKLSDKAALRIQLFAVVIGVLLLFAKFMAYLYTHSNTVLTDAIESIINVVAGLFALYSLYLASKPKDYDHPYGHGKVEFISAGFEGILIVIAGGIIIVKSVIGFFHSRPLEHLDIGIIVISVSGIINYVIGAVLEKAGTQNDSLTLKADGAHLKSDAYSSLGIFIGLILILCTGWGWLDNVVAIIFGFIIGFLGVRLVRKSIAGIMDEADESLIASIVTHLNEHRQTAWIDIHNLRVIQYGNKLHVDCHVTLPWYFTLEQAHHEIEEIAIIMNKKHKTQIEFFIHEDPCIIESCKICMIEDCPVRQEAFKEKIIWTVENVRTNRKHGLGI
ncbi:MAG: cation diffusion facilitator family transporter [Bacteroidota bacterium]|nr:cation diffusion facilitator family transporter [Bacteroidota bacterium]